MTTAPGFTPYCGVAPVPGDIAWNLDPVLLAGLVAGAALYARGRSAARLRAGGAEATAFYCGWGLVALALVSPLCNMGVALFSARIVQHMLIMLVAAPLLVRGRGDLLIWSGLTGRKPLGGGIPGRLEMQASPILFAAVLWFWHLSGPYDRALENNVVYWLMHLSLFTVAILLWRTLLREPRIRSGYCFLASVFTGAQMSALSALLTLAPRPWFSVHALTTWPWGLSPLQDQRLGGLIMWVPGGVLLTVYSLMLLARAVGEDRRSPPIEG